MPDADAFLALARSSPWRWSTLRFTERRRRARTWSEPRHAWLRRPDLLRVEEPSGRLLDVVRGTPTVSAVLGSSPWDPPPPVGYPVLGADGLVNQAIQALGGRPIKLLYTPFAVILALVHVMLPFMIIPVWTSLQKLDASAEQAALSLGAPQA